MLIEDRSTEWPSLMSERQNTEQPIKRDFLFKKGTPFVQMAPYQNERNSTKREEKC